MSTEALRFRAAGRLGATVLTSLGHSLRVTVEGDEPLREYRETGQPVIFVFWHSRIMPLAYLHRKEGIVVLISGHGDGEYIAQTIQRMGFGTARGSSTRGGVPGLRGLVRAARQGHDLAITPDGPQGPPRECKAGAIIAAQILGAPLIPLTAGGKGIWRLNSWDRLVIPKPFARITLKYGAPQFIPRNTTAEELGHHATVLETELNRITDSADDGGRDGVDADG
jgi:lysophospholipid acyltransferase (LPLAT)-like uncharacterized protein